MRIRLISGVTALMLILASLSVLASCSPAADNTPGAADTAAAADVDTTTAEPAETELRDNLPERDFNGREMVFAVYQDNIEDILVEAETGDVCNDAVFRRNMLIEERFNVKIVASTPSASMYNWYDDIVKLVLAGDDTFHVGGHYAYMLYKAVNNRIYQDWHQCDYIDFDASWWCKEINDSSTINGKLYGIVGNLGMSLLQYTVAFYYNVRMAENYGHLPADFYEMVRNSTWTFDVFSKMVSEMYIDVNGDSIRNNGDIFGWTMITSSIYDIWQNAFNLPFTGRDKDGKITLNYMTEKRQAALERMVDFYSNNPGVFKYTEKPIQTDWLWTEGAFFAAGLQVFNAGPVMAPYKIFREMEDPYGILPLPKWDEAQEGYYTYLNDRHTVWGIPITTTEYEFIGIITEALACESLKSVYPAFFDVALKSKYSEDADTAEMIDIVMAGRQFDVAFTFGETNSVFCNLPYIFRDLCKANSTDLASKYASIEDKILANLEGLYELY